MVGKVNRVLPNSKMNMLGFLVVWISVSHVISIQQSNLLFIMFDDLRPDLTINGRKGVITPNFERLARKSVTFNNAYCQVSVCNPSRDSLLTGLRPDTTGTYSFQWTFRPLMVFPTQLTRSGYNTRGIGKILHWETDPNVWNDQFKADWYDYQNTERDFMNSTTMPDQTRDERDFRDYLFTSKTIDAIKDFSSLEKYFFVGLGMKLPHLSMHVPYKYYEMYLDKKDSWKLTDLERKFPISTPGPAYRCCAEGSFRYMNNHGAKQSVREVSLGSSMDYIVPTDMRDELMLGYWAAISFIDAQLGRILDTIDELKLWNNLTIILTSDHGIHNGEKGLWEKWTLFDESTRVPLMIYHPDSPFKGQVYTEPVELIDIYPTINDLLQAPYDKKEVCKFTDPAGIYKCLPLQGKSLARVVLGDGWERAGGGVMSPRHRGKGRGRSGKAKGKSNAKAKSKSGSRSRDSKGVKITSEEESNRRLTQSDPFIPITSNNTHHLQLSESSPSSQLPSPQRMPILDMDFALTQSWRCTSKTNLLKPVANTPVWTDCSRDDNNNIKGNSEVSIMGYSMRTIDFRYTAWLHFNRTGMFALFDLPPLFEELYDHRKEKPDDFTHLEMVNLATHKEYSEMISHLKHKLLSYLKANIIFHGPYIEKPN